MVCHVGEVAIGTRCRIAGVVEQVGLVAATLVAPGAGCRTGAFHTGCGATDTDGLSGGTVARPFDGSDQAYEFEGGIGGLRAGVVAETIGLVHDIAA